MKTVKGILFLLSAATFAACSHTPTEPTSPTDDNAMQQEDSMMKSSDSMMKKDDVMIKVDGSAMIKSEGMMKSDGAMKDDDVMKSSSSLMQQETTVLSSEAMMKKGMYKAYSDGVVGNGAISVLFFHAGWCPVCKREDGKLTGWYEANAEKFLTTYKVNYDTSGELKNRYNVTYQHTFVKIDGQGNILEKIQGPSEEQLMTLLQK
jgi:thiol-disulfide isomerase/thioredoxin